MEGISIQKVSKLQLMDIEKEKRKNSKKQCYENIKWEDIKYDTKVTVNLIKIYLEAHSLKKSGKKEQLIDRIKLHIPVCTHTGNEIEESIEKETEQEDMDEYLDENLEDDISEDLNIESSDSEYDSDDETMYDFETNSETEGDEDISEGESDKNESESAIDDDFSEDDNESTKIIKTNFIKPAKVTVVIWKDNECDRIHNLK